MEQGNGYLAHAVYDYVARSEGELEFKSGDKLMVEKEVDENWCVACHCGSEQLGLVPLSYIERGAVSTSATKVEEGAAASQEEESSSSEEGLVEAVSKFVLQLFPFGSSTPAGHKDTSEDNSTLNTNDDATQEAKSSTPQNSENKKLAAENLSPSAPPLFEDDLVHSSHMPSVEGSFHASSSSSSLSSIQKNVQASAPSLDESINDDIPLAIVVEEAENTEILVDSTSVPGGNDQSAHELLKLVLGLESGTSDEILEEMKCLVRNRRLDEARERIAQLKAVSVPRDNTQERENERRLELERERQLEHERELERKRRVDEEAREAEAMEQSQIRSTTIKEQNLEAQRNYLEEATSDFSNQRREEEGACMVARSLQRQGEEDNFRFCKNRKALALETEKLAIQHENKKEFEKARTYYALALSYLTEILQNGRNLRFRRSLIPAMDRYIQKIFEFEKQEIFDDKGAILLMQENGFDAAAAANKVIDSVKEKTTAGAKQRLRLTLSLLMSHMEFCKKHRLSMTETDMKSLKWLIDYFEDLKKQQQAAQSR